MKTSAALIACMLATALAACASSAPQRNEQAAASAGPGDPDLWAAAALKSWANDRNPSQALNQIKKATELASKRADLAWLHVRLCIEAAGCEPEPFEARLRKLDPPNGAVWLGALGRAQARRDAQVEQQVLEAMSGAERFDLYWTSLVSKLTVALNNASAGSPAGQDPLTTSMNSVTSWLSTLSAPAFKPVTAACDGRRTGDAALAQRCQRIAQAMQRGDTTLVEALGLGIEQRFTPPGTSAASTVDRRVTRLNYLTDMSSSIIQAQVERDKFSAEMIELMKQLRREQEVSAAILRWAGEPTDPIGP